MYEFLYFGFSVLGLRFRVMVGVNLRDRVRVGDLGIFIFLGLGIRVCGLT